MYNDHLNSHLPVFCDNLESEELFWPGYMTSYRGVLVGHILADVVQDHILVDVLVVAQSDCLRKD